MEEISLLKKTLVTGIILLFIGICVEPYGTSIQPKEDIISFIQPDFWDVWTHAGETQQDVFHPYNIWTSENQFQRTINDKRELFPKSKTPKYIQTSPLTTSGNKTLYVGGSGPGNYTKIWEAINNASDGDTVFVYDDSSPYDKYYDRIFHISKSIKLIGENKETTILDGKHKSWCIDVIADGVTISGFTIRNYGDIVFNPYNYGGIMIFSSNNIITDNIIINNCYGIVISGSTVPANYNTISKNIIRENTNSGAYIQKSNYNQITNNTFSDNEGYGGLVLDNLKQNNISDNDFINDGVNVLNSYKNLFSNNIVNKKSFIYLEEQSNRTVEQEAGQIILINCENITIQNKNLSNTCVGILLDQTHNSRISGNTIFNSSSDMSGIMLRQSRNNNISMNSISNGYASIFFDASHDNTLFSNIISVNEYLGILLSGSNSNTILMNSFSDNRIGLSLENSRYNEVSENIFINDGVWSYGSYQNMFSNNLVNGKPLIYLDSKSDKIVTEAGQIILVKCNNITVQNQDLSNIAVGVLLDDTDNCLITSNSIRSMNLYGIFFTHSSGNNISMNNISDNHFGITFNTCEGNIILWNTISTSSIYGIWLHSSNGNVISNNIIKKNSLGWEYRYACVNLYQSSDNQISYNNFLLNGGGPEFYNSTLNKWYKNYWNRPRLLPKIIIGSIQSETFPFNRLRLNFDWRPALKPYTIP